MRVALNVGHNPVSPGNENQAVTEWSYNSEVAQHVRGVAVFFQHTDLNEVIQRMANWGPGLIVSLHLNANQDAALSGGTQYIYPGSRVAMRHAIRIGKAVQEALGIQNLGVQDATVEHMGQRPTLIYESLAPTVLLSPGYITNETDLAALIGNQEAYIEALSSILEAL